MGVDLYDFVADMKQDVAAATVLRVMNYDVTCNRSIKFLSLK